MIIIRERDPEFNCKFRELTINDTFITRIGEDKYVWLVIEGNTAINLFSGRKIQYKEDEIVIPVKCELRFSIKGK